MHMCCISGLEFIRELLFQFHVYTCKTASFCALFPEMGGGGVQGVSVCTPTIYLYQVPVFVFVLFSMLLFIFVQSGHGFSLVMCSQRRAANTCCAQHVVSIIEDHNTRVVYDGSLLDF